ncbi:MAG TPA: peptidoglycan editing factor PgeF [Rhodanobacteraceae bacterium]|nr:peptidoglycan editing factor PgeF [Rhodanobacteraceae bacterium]
MIDQSLRRRFAESQLQADWPAPANVRAFTTLRGPAGDSEPPFGPLNLGARSGDDLSTVAWNRGELAFYTSMPSPPHWLHQVHGTRVITFDQPVPHTPFRDWEHAQHALQVRAEPRADAAVTCTPGVVLAILTADCLPVLLSASDGSKVAAAHAGWRGLSAGVLEATLAAMQTPRADILAWLGPAIGAPSYEVGDEVREAFLACDPAAAPAFTTTRAGHWLCDLYALARQRLHGAGVKRVFGGSFDSFADPRFHSYRRDGARSGRMASLVWIVPTAD